MQVKGQRYVEVHIEEEEEEEGGGGGEEEEEEENIFHLTSKCVTKYYKHGKIN